MTLEINMDDFWMRTLKKSCSYNQIIPSEDFDGPQYLTFLDCATPKELSEDIIFESTFQKITPLKCITLNKHDNFSILIWMWRRVCHNRKS